MQMAPRDRETRVQCLNCSEEGGREGEREGERGRERGGRIRERERERETEIPEDIFTRTLIDQTLLLRVGRREVQKKRKKKTQQRFLPLQIQKKDAFVMMMMMMIPFSIPRALPPSWQSSTKVSSFRKKV